MSISVRLRNVSVASTRPSTPRATSTATELRVRRDHPQPVFAALGNLRAFITVLVVLHHVVIAYNVGIPAASADWFAEPRWWKAVPVMNTQRSIAWTLVTGFNDVFFMSLMFFLSGLFVWPSLERKGAATFLRARVRRLGWGFVLGAAALAPLAYYPSFAVADGRGPGEYVRAWLRLGEWPAGPVWFLWLLLAFDAGAALLFAKVRTGAIAAHPASSVFAEPTRGFVQLVAASCVAYLPMVALFGPLEWSTLGPFTLQTSRLVHYAVYFAAGVVMGARGIGIGWLAEGGALARRTPWWCASAAGAFLVLTALVLITPLTAPVWQSLLVSTAFVVSCAASSFALLALFLRVGGSRSLAWRGLRESAYGIYLVHFAVAAWVHYTLLGWAPGALAKGAVAFAVTLAVSWTAVSTLRRMPWLKEIL